MAVQGEKMILELEVNGVKPTFSHSHGTCGAVSFLDDFLCSHNNFVIALLSWSVYYELDKPISLFTPRKFIEARSSGQEIISQIVEGLQN